MNWENERYVRLYVRDTGEWNMLSWDAQALFMQLLRKVDRAGVLQLGKHGTKVLPAVLNHKDQVQRIEAALDELIEDGCIQIKADYLVIPNFLAAQEAAQSDKARQRESRAKRRELAMAGHDLDGDAGHAVSQNVTESHAASRDVTSSHSASQPVTPSLAVPNCDKPSQAEPARLNFLDALAALVEGLGGGSAWQALQAQEHASTTGLPPNIENAWSAVWRALCEAKQPPTAEDMRKLGRWWARGGAAKCKKQRFNYLASVERMTEWFAASRVWDGESDPTPSDEQRSAPTEPVNPIHRPIQRRRPMEEDNAETAS